MTTDEIIKYCLAKNGAYVDFPFWDTPMCIKVSKRLFAQIYPKFYRDAYPGTVVRGYHCPPAQQPYFNTVYLDKVISDDELKSMIDHSYSAVVGKLPKKQRESLLSGKSAEI